MEVPLLDLKKQYESIREEVMSAVKDLFDSQRFILGPEVDALERQVADYCQCEYAVGVSSGTDALLISLMASGVGFGDLVITTPYTFFATAGAIARIGARPVFVDIDSESYNMDPANLEVVLESMDEEEKSKLKAVIPVHLFGQCVAMEPILEVIKPYGLTVIEDAAQAIGAEYAFKDGSIKKAGSMGQFGCFSFFPSKNLGAFGDGGMVTTNEKHIYERLKILRVHGAEPKYYHSVIGGNFRLDSLQAAVLAVKLKYLDKWTTKRIDNARCYRKLFKEAGIEQVALPQQIERRHIYNQFVISIKDKRDQLKAFLYEQGIGCEVYYPVPLHMQRCFEYLGYRPHDFPESLKAAKSSLALPVYPELTFQQMEYVVDMIKEFVNSFLK